MADPRWRLFWHYDIIVTWCDVIFPRDVYHKIGVWTSYIFPKFRCDCLNILAVTAVWKDPKKPGLNRVNKLRFPWRPVFFGLGTISEKISVGDHFHCAKFHACIKKCTIQLKFRAKPPDYLCFPFCEINCITA